MNNSDIGIRILEEKRKEWKRSNKTKKIILIREIIAELDKVGLITDSYGIQDYFNLEF